MKKLLLGLLILLLLISACGGAATSTPQPTATPEATATGMETSPTRQPTREPVATFEEGACRFEVPPGATVECGLVVVAEDHNKREGPTMKLAIAVIGPLLFLWFANYWNLPGFRF